MMHPIIDNMVEVRLIGDSFLKVKETLTRIGVASRKEKTLFHKQGRYFIVHFKELFSLDGKETDFDTNDIARRNTIANLLADWELIELTEPNKSKDNTAPISQIKILPFKEKSEWQLVTKYNIGKKRE